MATWWANVDQGLCWRNISVFAVWSRVSLRLEVPPTSGTGNRPRDCPTLWWKMCLFLLPGNANAGEGSDARYSQRVTTWGTAQEKQSQLQTPQLSRLVFHIPGSNTSCLSCTVFIKIGCYLSFATYLRNYKYVRSWLKRKTRNKMGDLFLFS